MTDHDKLLARMDTWLGTGDSDTADFLCDMRDAAAAIRVLKPTAAAQETGKEPGPATGDMPAPAAAPGPKPPPRPRGWPEEVG